MRVAKLRREEWTVKNVGQNPKVKGEEIVITKYVYRDERGHFMPVTNYRRK
jgi:hypothetical protein